MIRIRLMLLFAAMLATPVAALCQISADVAALERRAAAGEAAAMLALGSRLAMGDGVARDVPRGVALLESAAALGNNGAAYNFGFIQYRVLHNPAAGFPWLLRAATAGNREAVRDIVEMYRKGVGTPADPLAAIRWLKIGAREDFSGERSQLVEIYTNGSGVPADRARAYGWMLLAGESMSPEARGVVRARATPGEVVAGLAFADRCRASQFVDCD